MNVWRIAALLALVACKPVSKGDSPPGTPPTTTTPTPPPPPPPPADADLGCARVDTSVQFWSAARQAYRDLLPTALAKGWSTSEYNAAAQAKAVSALPPDSAASGASSIDVGTNCLCQTHGLDEQCAAWAAKGVPQVICDASRAHEAVHVKQCQANNALPAGSPGKWGCDDKNKPTDSVSQRAAYEDEAYAATLQMVQAYAGVHCPKGCKEMAKAKSWTSSIQISYHRHTSTSYTDEQLDGVASSSSTLTLGLVGLSMSIGGYSVTWQGAAVGTGTFDDVEQQQGGGAPFEGHGSGALVPKPPLGRFNAEILRIDPDKCLYAFETSAVTASTWSDGTSAPDGVHVQLGKLPIPAKGGALTGTQTLSLPVSHFDWPGPAATMPHEPMSGGHVSGTLTVSWTFTPGP